LNDESHVVFSFLEMGSGSRPGASAEVVASCGAFQGP
jgi:hypothetical protein